MRRVTWRAMCVRPDRPLDFGAQLGLGPDGVQEGAAVRQGLTLVHFSAQREPLVVTDATATVHFLA